MIDRDSAGWPEFVTILLLFSVALAWHALNTLRVRVEALESATVQLEDEPDDWLGRDD